MPDPAHRLTGRGAYLHRDPQCYTTAIRRKALTRALRLASALDSDTVLDELKRPVGSNTRPTTKADPS